MEKYLQVLVDFLESQDWLEDESEFAMLQYDLVDQMEADQVGVESIQPIFELMEKYPLVEFGTPGSLTHFIEGFYKANSAFYEEVMLQSVLKQPTVHTVWLLNRVINGTTPEHKKTFVQILKSIAEQESMDQAIRQTAASFLSYHSNA